MIDPRNAFPYNDNIVESTVFLFEYLINDTRESAFCTETGIVSLFAINHLPLCCRRIPLTIVSEDICLVAIAPSHISRSGKLAKRAHRNVADVGGTVAGSTDGAHNPHAGR